MNWYFWSNEGVQWIILYRATKTELKRMQREGYRLVEVACSEPTIEEQRMLQLAPTI